MKLAKIQNKFKKKYMSEKKRRKSYKNKLGTRILKLKR